MTGAEVLRRALTWAENQRMSVTDRYSASGLLALYAYWEAHQTTTDEDLGTWDEDTIELALAKYG